MVSQLRLGIHRRLCSATGMLPRPAASSTTPAQSAEGSKDHFALLPCATCTEIKTGEKYAAWLDNRENLEETPAQTPQAPVIFEAGEMPPAYMLRLKSGKWCLGQGVGPGELELKLPHQLPAGQFRTLLPQAAAPVRPLCWQKEAEDAAEPTEVWSSRQVLIETVVDHAALTAVGWKSGSKDATPLRAPPVTIRLSWLPEVLLSAAEAWAAQDTSGVRRRQRGSQKCVITAQGDGTRFVPVPLLRVVDEVRPLVDAITACWP